jgi:RNA polymerase-interacting CarD/CdnL/TRCF family regulator
MARRNLADLVREERSDPRREGHESTPSARFTEEDQTEQQRAAVPKYLTLLRKEARLREDQTLALARLARQLNRQKRKRGERITENTLIRVAVDLLLSQEDQIRGATEEEIREALHSGILTGNSR